MAGSTVKDAVSKGKRRFGLEAPSAADADGPVGIVRGALKAWGDGDLDGFLDTFDNSAEWEAPSGDCFPGAGEHKGRDAIRDQFIADVERTYTEFGFRPTSFLDADDEDAVVVLGRFEGKGVQGGNVDTSGVQVWEFNGNSVVKVCTITDTAQFPEVITEDKQKQFEEEDREKEREEKEKEKESERDEPEGKGDADESGEDSDKQRSDDDSDDED
jgi:ketosteroid isomerase-like protein